MHSTHVHPGHHPQHHHVPNGHHTHHHHQPNGHQPNGHPSSHKNPPQPKEPVHVVGIPSVTVENNQLLVGDSQSSSTRSYTPLKVVGDGSFGTVWLCDWHGTLPPNTPLSAMQCSAGARPEYANKRLVAVKRMKKRWEGGWDECKRLKELESLRAIPNHPNIIPLYDFFLLPTTKELYFVFESMEGNLYQLIKTRKGKPLAGGLVSSIFSQVVSGLHHIHSCGYFHRDMKPENLLVTTTGLYDYRPVYPNAPPDAPSEPDVVVIVKLADFGLARETRSKPPYTEYVSTRWYRAPEVLLKSRDYSAPVDMWALGTIMAELVNLRPLFPGSGEVDQVARICDLLGDPLEDYGVDARGKSIGGGKWSRGVKMARAVGFQFPKVQPKNIYALFDRTVPVKLVDCIADLLKYDPDARLTSAQCMEHPYLLETAPLNRPPPPPTQVAFTPQHRPHRNGNGVSSTSLPSVPARDVPPSHSHAGVNPASPPQLVIPHIPEAATTHRTSFYDATRSRTVSDVSSVPHAMGPNGPYIQRHPDLAQLEIQHAVPAQNSSERFANIWTPGQPNGWDAMDVVSPTNEVSRDQYASSPHHMEIQQSPMAQEYPARPAPEPEPPLQDPAHAHDVSHSQSGKFQKLGFNFGKKPTKWNLGGMFGGHGDKHSQQQQQQQGLPPVHEVVVTSAESTPSLQRNSSSTDSRSLSEFSPDIPRPPNPPPLDEKARKKEAKQMAEEAERQRRARIKEMQIEQARAVMRNKRRLAEAAAGKDLNWLSSHPGGLVHGGKPYDIRQSDKGKHPAVSPGPMRQTHSHGPSSPTLVNGNSIMNSPTTNNASYRSDWRVDSERVPKARRREFDDDHSMSSSDIPSGVSVISFATVDSDPGPTRHRHRPNPYGMSRMTSMSSLRPSSIDDFPSTARSSASLSLEQQLVNDFHLRASVDSSSVSDGGSPQPPPMHMLSLSSPIPWQHSESSTTVDQSAGSSRQTLHSPIYSPPPQPLHPEFKQGPLSPYDTSGMYAHPPSPGMAPKSAINPIFKVPPVDKPAQISLTTTALPPFSHLEAVADGEYPPLSPMSFTIPEEAESEDS
ncbi:Pkinase-domain-containing protein [Panus rudis PR-1116 ss-1]|nr:Pkinase-domain-containing protein [Panus rudis PR-1116 ss-1]